MLTLQARALRISTSGMRTDNRSLNWTRSIAPSRVSARGATLLLKALLAVWEISPLLSGACPSKQTSSWRL